MRSPYPQRAKVQRANSVILVLALNDQWWGRMSVHRPTEAEAEAIMRRKLVQSGRPASWWDEAHWA